MSAIGSLLYIGSHGPHFQCLQANLNIINLFFPTNARPYQQYSHTDTVTNYHYISLPAINKTFLEIFHTYFCCFSLVNAFGAMLLKDCQKLTAITSCYTALSKVLIIATVNGLKSLAKLFNFVGCNQCRSSQSGLSHPCSFMVYYYLFDVFLSL